MYNWFITIIIQIPLVITFTLILKLIYYYQFKKQKRNKKIFFQVPHTILFSYKKRILAGILFVIIINIFLILFIIPVFVLPIGKTLQKFSSNKYFWIFFYIILGFSVFTQIIGVLTSPLAGIEEYAVPGKIRDLTQNGPDILIYNLVKNN